MLSWLLACGPGTVLLLSDDSGTPDSVPNETATTDSGTPPVETGDSTPPIDDTAPPSDDFTLTLDAEVVTMIHATWTSAGATDAWVESRWGGGDWEVAPVLAAGESVLLGFPAETEVEARAVEVVDGVTVRSHSATITTGPLPDDLLVPTIDLYEADLVEPARWAMISVAVGSYTYEPSYWIEIFDREGRVVWYHEVPDDMMTFYPTVAHDGTHIWFEGENIFGIGRATPFVTRRTLDGRWEQTLEVADLGQAIGEGPDGAFFYEKRSRTHALGRLEPDGSDSVVWDCSTWMRDHGEGGSACNMNTTNWSEEHDSVLASMFESDTVFEIDLATGAPIRQMGQLEEGEPYSFSPAESMFAYQHDVYWTDAGTILASTHIAGVSGVQVAAEYTVDDTTKTLTRIWEYVSTDLWATQVGEAVRLPHGNTVQGYGQDGAVREVTPDGTPVWQASWEKDRQGYRVVGHLSLFDDLYALNVGD